MQITIYHTNDIHSNYEFLKNVHAYLATNRTENDFYFDSGDYNDLKSFLVQSDKGISAMELLMECRPDAMALGNNEIDLEYEAIARMAAQGFPILCCNLTDGDGHLIEGLEASRIFEKAGKRFLLLAVAPYFGANFRPNAYNLFFEMGNLKTQDSFRCIREELDRQQGKYDYCILLSHSGLKVDGEIHRQFPEIDLILGGHTHNILSEPGYSQSGRGERLGKIVLQIEKQSIREIENLQLELPEVENPVFESIWKEKEQIADSILSKELPVLEELSFDAFEECKLINFICDALRKHCGGDLAIMHHGIAEHSLLRPVSAKSLLEIFPSKLNPTLFPVLGENIEEAVRQSLEEEHIRQNGEGAGFRGKVLGTLGFSSNVRIEQEPLRILVDGRELDKKREYWVVADDYLQRGSGYPALKVPDERARFEKWFIRDLARHYLQDTEVFETMKIRRKHRGKQEKNIEKEDCPG